jgi:hypothetical protein
VRRINVPRLLHLFPQDQNESRREIELHEKPPRKKTHPRRVGYDPRDPCDAGDRYILTEACGDPTLFIEAADQH